MNLNLPARVQIDAIHDRILAHFDVAGKLNVSGRWGEFVRFQMDDPPEGLEEYLSDVGRLAIYTPRTARVNEVVGVEVYGDSTPVTLIVEIAGVSKGVAVDLVDGAGVLELTATVAGRVVIRHESLPACAYVEVQDA